MNILLLSAHADDVELGMGGFLSKLVRKKIHNFYWITFAPPYGVSHSKCKEEFNNSVDYLNPNIKRKLMDLKTRYFYTERQNLLDLLVKVRNEFKPDLVFGPATTDKHQDHEILSEEMFRCFKNSCTIFGYEMPWNQMVSNASIYVSLDMENMKDKWEMLLKYETQKEARPCIFDRNLVIGHARSCGSVIKTNFAEKFECIRQIFIK